MPFKRLPVDNFIKPSFKMTSLYHEAPPHSSLVPYRRKSKTTLNLCKKIRRVVKIDIKRLTFNLKRAIIKTTKQKGGAFMFKKFAMLSLAALLVAGGAVYRVNKQNNDSVVVLRAA